MRSRRVYEFVNYHINGDGECNGIVLKKWADIHNLDSDSRMDICFFFAVTYCVESAIVMHYSKIGIFEKPEEWAQNNKNKLIFQSDRKYIKMRDSFEKCLKFFCENVEEIRKIGNSRKLDLRERIPEVEKWVLFGRFSAYLFLETVAHVMGCEIINAEMEWENGDTATSGLLNVFGYDKSANYFDKTGKLPNGINQNWMETKAQVLLTAIEKTGGNPNITMVETSLCAYRKFFKGSRYNGYYLDRMLEEIKKMSKDFPKISEELVQIRMKTFDSKYLGEVGGWNGVRKECKKLYKEKGIIM